MAERSGLHAAPLTGQGKPFPLGPTVCATGTNFSLFSANATMVELLFFKGADDSAPSAIVAFDVERNRTSQYWHILVCGVTPGQLYGFRVHGPDDPAAGHRFDSQKVLLDPYGRSVAVGKNYSRAAGCIPGDTAATCMKSVVVDPDAFDWEDDAPLNRSFRQTVIYEMHVGGFTKDPNSGVTAGRRGTYLGMVEKIPYLLELGVTAVELLPVFQFDPQDTPHGLENYWGYDPVSFFAPHLGYCTDSDPQRCMDEFRTMVKALHNAGIEVILDVVYNHTSEGDEHGPTVCFRGIENSVYYILNSDKAGYANFTGSGNTLKANQSVVKRLILDSLTYWVSEMHVDGFRFDLASVFSRNQAGEPMVNAPIIWEIDSHPALAGTKLIAEAWDEGGLYQVGTFGPDKWKEWNGQFRDDLRAFVKGEQGTVLKLRERITGSLDLYGAGDRPTGQSINFVTSHDGFTMNDLVSYNSKHNEANREGNRDGTDANHSWNCGVEGPSEDDEICSLRLRQIKNLFALTLLSAGTPMLLMGDEGRRTQRGNNNCYCHDDETSWLDWSPGSRNADLNRFVARLIKLRVGSQVEGMGGRLTLQEYQARVHYEWHGVELGKPNWNADSHAIAFTVRTVSLTRLLYVAINSFWNVLSFELPGRRVTGPLGWRRLVDTSLAAPDDVADADHAVTIAGDRYLVNPRSLVVLETSLIQAAAEAS